MFIKQMNNYLLDLAVKLTEHPITGQRDRGETANEGNSIQLGRDQPVHLFFI